MVRNIPHELFNEGLLEFFKYFGAKECKLMTENGPLKYCVFIGYLSLEDANVGYDRLNGLYLLDKPIRVSYVKHKKTVPGFDPICRELGYAFL